MKPDTKRMSKSTRREKYYQVMKNHSRRKNRLIAVDSMRNRNKKSNVPRKRKRSRKIGVRKLQRKIHVKENMKPLIRNLNKKFASMYLYETIAG